MFYNMLGPRLMVNVMGIVMSITKKPMLRLLVRDVQRPLYHMVFFRRVYRITWQATFGDMHDTFEIIEEILEDSTPAMIDAFVYADFAFSVAMLLHFLLDHLHTKR